MWILPSKSIPSACLHSPGRSSSLQPRSSRLLAGLLVLSWSSGLLASLQPVSRWFPGVLASLAVFSKSSRLLAGLPFFSQSSGLLASLLAGL